MARGGVGDFVVLNDGTPWVQPGPAFRAMHVPIPVRSSDDIMRLRETLRRILMQRIEFDEDDGAEELVDVLLTTIATVEVAPA